LEDKMARKQEEVAKQSRNNAVVGKEPIPTNLTS
jgi:hypothetical protein